ncbi:MAG: Molybdopterin synthase sulfur carrier subunit, partial [uncultured Rubrobacteraceae bacterium]
GRRKGTALRRRRGPGGNPPDGTVRGRRDDTRKPVVRPRGPASRPRAHARHVSLRRQRRIRPGGGQSLARRRGGRVAAGLGGI